MLNISTVMGRLVRDPELRNTASGTAATSFTVACDRDFQKDGNNDTDFINCVAWSKTAEFISKYFHKGSMIIVNGRLQSRGYEDRDGNKRTVHEIVADHVWFGEKKQDGTKPVFVTLDESDGDLPF